MSGGPRVDDGSDCNITMTSGSTGFKKPEMEALSLTQVLPANNHTSPNLKQHTKSVPATPSQRPTPSPDNNNIRSSSQTRNVHNSSPTSQSESSQTPPKIRKLQGACKYETGMAKARRRVPYSFGPEKLNPEHLKLKERLDSDAEAKVTKDMQHLFAELVPSTDDEDLRTRLVQKLEDILRKRWPTAMVNVNVFGSTGNNLGTSESDVDICITTDSKEMTKVCFIADLLAKHGMERVVCVSSAKVPIVKIWDPELQLACDMNVNNPIALENTAMIKSYVAIDPRVRPLAMIIKHWAKKRILNDAALGGTLSSYTWICLTLNFLQTRNPPILPSLQQSINEPHLISGVNVAFDKNINSYKGFGKQNEATLGELLHQFFRYYGHEFDFEKNVVSVRLGKLLRKSEKGWHMLQDNRLCVEEPFNYSRNLANTADDTSMRGIHLELRRAFGLIADGQLEKCCEQYIYPPDEPKLSEHFVPPSSKPIVAQVPNQSIRGKNNGRGGKPNANQGRNANMRRSSNPQGRNTVYLRNLPFPMTTQELQLQQQHQQHLLHDQLFQQYQYLQMQEQELRMQLQQRSLHSRGLLQTGNYMMAGHSNYASSSDENGDMSTSTNFPHVPHTAFSAPLHQRRFGGTSPYLPTAVPNTGITTNPSSPHPQTAMLDTRRLPRRTSMTVQPNGAPLRAHSQPARTMTAAMMFAGVPLVAGSTNQDERRSSTSSVSQEGSGFYSQAYTPTSSYDIHRRPAEYVGYYIGRSPSLFGYPASGSISPIPSHVGLAIQNGGLSPRIAARSPRAVGISPIPVKVEPSRAGVSSNTTHSQQNRQQYSAEERALPTSTRVGPLIVNGSVTSPQRKRTNEPIRSDGDDHTVLSASTSEDLTVDTPSSSDEQSLDMADTSRAGNIATSALRNLSAQDDAGGMRLPNSVVRPSAYLINGEIHKEKQQPSGITGQSKEIERPLPLAWSLGRQLSSVQESKSPVLGDDQQRQKIGLSHSASISSNQNQLNTSAKLVNDTKYATSPENPVLTPKPNGGNFPSNQIMGISSIGSMTAWQTQKKKKKAKKGVNPDNDIEATNPLGGEFLPANESERKGG